MSGVDLIVFLADGFEETEAIATVDLLRRAELSVKTVSVTGSSTVVGSHGVAVKSDAMFSRDTVSDARGLVLPGGPGHTALMTHPGVRDAVLSYAREGKLLAAICAAPVILGSLGLLKGRRAVCYPGMESGLIGAALAEGRVVRDEGIITANGPGAAYEFALAIIGFFCGESIAERVANAFCC
jgi:4-methyl-5(b-hydroxyethyl)-thiazole monophosphate biosynthesis